MTKEDQAREAVQEGLLARCPHGNGVCCPQCQSENDLDRAREIDKNLKG